MCMFYAAILLVGLQISVAKSAQISLLIAKRRVCEQSLQLHAGAGWIWERIGMRPLMCVEGFKPDA